MAPKQSKSAKKGDGGSAPATVTPNPPSITITFDDAIAAIAAGKSIDAAEAALFAAKRDEVRAMLEVAAARVPTTGTAPTDGDDRREQPVASAMRTKETDASATAPPAQAARYVDAASALPANDTLTPVQLRIQLAVLLLLKLRTRLKPDAPEFKNVKLVAKDILYAFPHNRTGLPLIHDMTQNGWIATGSKQGALLSLGPKGAEALSAAMAKAKEGTADGAAPRLPPSTLSSRTPASMLSLVLIYHRLGLGRCATQAFCSGAHQSVFAAGEGETASAPVLLGFLMAKEYLILTEYTEADPSDATKGTVQYYEPTPAALALDAAGVRGLDVPLLQSWLAEVEAGGGGPEGKAIKKYIRTKPKVAE